MGASRFMVDETFFYTETGCRDVFNICTYTYVHIQNLYTTYTNKTKLIETNQSQTARNWEMTGTMRAPRMSLTQELLARAKATVCEPRIHEETVRRRSNTKEAMERPSSHWSIQKRIDVQA